jgi:uncharacterized iron-regulated membrane protein
VGLAVSRHLALTGALLGLSTLIVAALALLLYRGDRQQVYRLFIDPPPPADARAMPMPDLATLLTRAHTAMPGASPQSVVIERPGRADMRVSVRASAPATWCRKTTCNSTPPGASSRRSACKTIHRDQGAGRDRPGPLWFGGAPVRVVYGLLGVALCVVTSSGITIWLARRRDRGRAAPGWGTDAGDRLGPPLVLAITAACAARPHRWSRPGWSTLALWLWPASCPCRASAWDESCARRWAPRCHARMRPCHARPEYRRRCRAGDRWRGGPALGPPASKNQTSPGP